MKKEKETVKKPSLIISVLKLPFTLARNKRIKNELKQIRKKRESIGANYSEFKIVKTHTGNYKDWEKELLESDSKIGIILGARGSGKSAYGIKLLENMFAKTKRKCYAMGFNKDEMPGWIEIVEKIEEIKNNAIVLIDEGGILFSSRKTMTKPNKLLSDLILVARHKNLSILFITQNSSNLDVNVIRQADYLVLKPTSLLQKDFERKKIQEIYREIEKEFGKYREDKGISHIYSDKFRGFVSNPLPSFWNVKISKSFS